MATQIHPGAGRRVSEFDEIGDLPVDRQNERSEAQRELAGKYSELEERLRGEVNPPVVDVPRRDVSWAVANFLDGRGQPLSSQTAELLLRHALAAHSEVVDLQGLERQRVLKAVLFSEFYLQRHHDAAVDEHKTEEDEGQDRETSESGQAKTQRRRFSKPFLALSRYLLFVFVFLCFILVNRSSQTFWLSQGLTDRLIESSSSEGTTFSGLSTMGPWFDWMTGVFIPTMYPQGSSCFDRQFIADNVHLRVGSVRLRQLRVEKDTCEIPSIFEDAMDRCFAPWSQSIEHQGRYLGTSWQSAQELDTDAFYSSHTRHTFPGSGYVELLPNRKQQATALVNSLYSSTWLDMQTRAVFVEFLLFNLPTSKLVTGRILLQLGAEGDAVPSANFYSSNIYAQHKAINEGIPNLLSNPGAVIPGLFIGGLVGVLMWWLQGATLVSRKNLALATGVALFVFFASSAVLDYGASGFPSAVYISLALEVAVLITVLVQTTGHVVRAVAIKKAGHSVVDYYTAQPFKLLSLLNDLIFSTIFALRIASLIMFQNIVLGDLEDQWGTYCGGSDGNNGCAGGNSDCAYPFISFFKVQAVEQKVDELLAFNSLIVFLLLFKYLNIFKSLAVFAETLYEATRRMVTVCVIIAIVMTGFSMSFYLAFGWSDGKYRDFFESAKTLFEVVLGDFDIKTIRAINPYLAPFFFVLFVLIMIMVILSMFVAIVNSAYHDSIERLEYRHLYFFVNHLHKHVVDQADIDVGNSRLLAALGFSRAFRKDPVLANMKVEDDLKIRTVLVQLENALAEDNKAQAKARAEAAEANRQRAVAAKLAGKTAQDNPDAAADQEDEQSVSSFATNANSFAMWVSSTNAEQARRKVSLPLSPYDVRVSSLLTEQLRLAAGTDEKLVREDMLYIALSIRNLIAKWSFFQKLLPSDDFLRDTLLQRGAFELGGDEAGGETGQPTTNSDAAVPETKEDQIADPAPARSFQTKAKLSPPEALILERLEAPRFAVLKQLAALEGQQRRMLDAIESVGKRSRHVANTFSELRSRKELAIRNAKESQAHHEKIVRTSMLPLEGENDF